MPSAPQTSFGKNRLLGSRLDMKTRLPWPNQLLRALTRKLYLFLKIENFLFILNLFTGFNVFEYLKLILICCYY